MVIAGEKWQLVEGIHLSWRIWDEEFVVYNHGSGDTHLLDEPAAVTLHLFETKPDPVNLEDVVFRLTDIFEAESSEDLYAHGQDILFNLQRLGLIETSSL